MELSKTLGISIDYKDRRNSPNWDLVVFAEVVFIDRTQTGPKPLLYQLKDSLLPNIHLSLQTGPLVFSREAFVLLGEASSLDKKKKQILLSNGNTVSYHYLVEVSGTKPVLTVLDEEFMAGIHALIDALRVKSKIPDSLTFCSPFLNSNHSKTIPQILSAPPLTLGKIVQPYMVSANAKPIQWQISTVNKRLYLVQL